MFFQGSFSGYVEDVVTLAHESGHAVQNMLMTSNRVLPRYASGPAYFTESFGGLSELLLLDQLYRTAPDRAHRIFYLQRLIRQGAEVFRNGWESLVEQQLFDSTAAGRSLSADDIEAMTQRTGSQFSVWFGPGSERKLAWVQPTQFFTRPLYRVNYVYSKLLALRYFDLLQTKRGKFAQRYLALLSHGYDAPPDTLLRRFVDTRLDDPMLIEGAVGVLRAWLADLEVLYRS
jgi:oligoendopeptidase F